MWKREDCYEGISPTFIFKGGKHTRVGAAFIINETVCEISGPMGVLEWSRICSLGCVCEGGVNLALS